MIITKLCESCGNGFEPEYQQQTVCRNCWSADDPTPEEKHPDIDALLTALSGKDRKQTILKKGCVFCTDPNLNFRDQVSRDEYRISGQCQTCQDKFFNSEESE